MHTLALTRLCILLAAVTLALGLVAPCMVIVPGFGELDSWVKLLKPAMLGQSEYSVLGGTVTMMRHDNVGIGLLLLFFSAFFPTAKLAIMAYAQQMLAQHRPAGPWLGMVHQTGKFSMLDVLVLALFVITLKGLPGSSEIRLQWGVWCFAASVVLSLVASILLHRLERLQRVRVALPGSAA